MPAASANLGANLGCQLGCQLMCQIDFLRKCNIFTKWHVHADKSIPINNANIKHTIADMFVLACADAPDTTVTVEVATAASLAAPVPIPLALVIGLGTIVAPGTPAGPSSISLILSVVELKFV